MKPEDKAQAKTLADEHWEWFQKIAGGIAKDFFLHGFKHGVDTKRRRARK